MRKKSIIGILFMLLYMIVLICIKRLFFSEDVTILNTIVVGVLSVIFMAIYLKIIGIGKNS